MKIAPQSILAPRVCAPERVDGVWTQQACLKASNPGPGDFFGVAIALSGDGNTVAVGAYHEDSAADGINSTEADTAPDAGAAYVFTPTAGVWTQQAYIKASNSDAGDVFGVSIALSNGGSYIDRWWLSEDSNATGVGGDGELNSELDSGAAYVFTRSGVTWSQQAYLKASNTGAGDHFGSWLSLSGVAATLGIGPGSKTAMALRQLTIARLIREPPMYLHAAEPSGINKPTLKHRIPVRGICSAPWSPSAMMAIPWPSELDRGGIATPLAIGGNEADNSAADSGAVYVFARSAGSGVSRPTSRHIEHRHWRLVRSPRGSQ